MYIKWRTGLLNIVRMIIDHPRYTSEEARQMKVIGKKDAFFRKEEKYQYPPDITPLKLAAHHNDHEIIQLFLSRGYTIDRCAFLPVTWLHHRQVRVKRLFALT